MVRRTKVNWHRKPPFGSLYLTKGSPYIYISMNYFKERLRFPTDKEDTPENWEELFRFLQNVGDKIRLGTFRFAETFYWLNEETKERFTKLEGNEYHPDPHHVCFGEYAKRWMEKKSPNFSSSKRKAYRSALRSSLPHFENTVFAAITTEALEDFIDKLNYRRADNGARSETAKKQLTVKRIKNIMIPMRKIWLSACNANNWNLRNPFPGLKEKYDELEDLALQRREQVLFDDPESEPKVGERDTFLLSEWQRILRCIDPHYHVVMELMLRGMIGSELEALLKRNINVQRNEIEVRHKISREVIEKKVLVNGKEILEKEVKVYFGLKLKNWYRKREIPLTVKMKKLLEESIKASTSETSVVFANDVILSGEDFVLTMKDGSPFAYGKFRKEWHKAVAEAGVPYRVPYAARHTLVQWALLIGITKTRLVAIMGHCNKGMIDNVYGLYRMGLVEEKERILDYLGEDFLAEAELKVSFPERYAAHVKTEKDLTQTKKTPNRDTAFGQSNSQSQEFNADNYDES